MTASELVTLWRTDADVLERRGCADVARILSRCADELEASGREAADAPLTLSQAAAEGGYSRDRLRHLIAKGAIPNAGTKGAPRIRRADVPRKPVGVSSFDPAAAARRSA